MNDPGKRTEAPPELPPLPLLVHAPYRDDASTVARLLKEYYIDTRPIRDAGELDAALEEQAGILLISQEGLSDSVLATVKSFLERQPRWSEFPIILLLDDEFLSHTPIAEVQQHFPRAKLTLLQRPIRAAELATVVRVSLSARARQFAVRSFIEKQEELRRELNHRVKNVLSSVQALYELTLRNSSNLEGFASDFEGRLAALSSVHEVLFSVDYGSPLLTDIVDTIVAPYRGGGRQRIHVSGPSGLRLQSDSAMVFAMSLHELTTNALKYGALSIKGGTIEAGWKEDRRHDEDRIDFWWIERGGPRVRPPEHSGYGTSFIRSAVENRLGGETSFDFCAPGLEVRLSIPSESLVSP